LPNSAVALDELRTLRTLDTSALVWWVRTVPSQVPKCLGPFLMTTVYSMLKKRRL